jgi:Ca-activated chloride channel family protein
MIRKSGNRFSEKIMLKQKARALFTQLRSREARSMDSPLLSIRARSLRLTAIALAAILACQAPARAAEPQPTPCNQDAMIVFDASGSMSGVVGGGIATPVTRIDEVRSALAQVLPSATKFRRVGLITYGPGPYNQCNVHLDLKPVANAAEPIMRAVNALTPAGKTPLTSAVEQAAGVLEFRAKPGLIVVVTDGEETCGGSPCALAKQLHEEADQLTIHIIGYRTKGASWTGEQNILDAHCLPDQNNGLFISAETEEDLVGALEKTLDCPMISQRATP